MSERPIKFYVLVKKDSDEMFTCNGEIKSWKRKKDADKYLSDTINNQNRLRLLSLDYEVKEAVVNLE